MGKIHLVFLFLGLFFTQVIAQTGTITGVVTDRVTGETLPGANIVIQGTTTGAVSDIDGRYSFSAPAGSVTLVASFIGYDPLMREVTVVAGQTIRVNFELTQDIALLQEFIVIGYGVQRREDATGSVAVIDSRDFNRGNITTPSELLTGKIPGLQITTAGGAPGSGATIRIRGGSSLAATNDPLIVIDGVPVATEGIVGMRNPLSTLNPNDIESFTVLKDASAAAIYGSRASNGVIIITTKKGVEGAPTRVDYIGNYSLGTNANRIQVLDRDRFREIIQERYANQPNVLNRMGPANTVWQDQIYRDAFGQDHNVTISGSLNVVPYRLSIGYGDFDGVLRTDNMNRASAALALNPTLLDGTLKVNLNARGTRVNNNFADVGAISAAVMFDPTQPVRVDASSPAGRYGGYFAWLDAQNRPMPVATTNPVALLDLREDVSTVDRFLGNVQFDYQLPFIPQLHANLNLAYDWSQTDGSVFVPDYAAWEFVAGGVDNIYDQNKRNELLDFYLNYVSDFSADHRFDLMGGYSWQRFYRQGSALNRNIPGNIAQTEYREIPSDYETQSFLISFFGRLNYSLLDRYLFTATLRNDGSSRFIGDNKWGLFPSFAFAWRVINEPFMGGDDGFLSDLKLRLGYGVTGQQAITDNNHPALARYSLAQAGAYYQFGDELIRTLRPEGYDANLKWEETTTYNVGLDFGFLQGRYYGNLDVYFRETRDLINEIPVPAGTNLTNFILTNIGSLENQGVEFNIFTRPIVRRDMNWTLGFNATYNETKITQLTAVQDPTYQGVLVGGISGGVGNTIQIHSVGHAPNSFYVFQQVYDPQGNPIEGVYVDRSGDGTITDDDRYRLNSPVPTYYFGLTSDFALRNWNLSFTGRANLGNWIYDNVRSMNVDLSRLHRPEGPYLSNIMPDAIDIGFRNAQYISDFFIRDASFFKMDNISLGYNLREILGARTNLFISATVQNAFVITRYQGLDPEVAGGIDNNMYPRPRNFVLGVNLQL